MLLPLTVLAAFITSLLAKLLADTFITSRIAILGSFAGLQYSENPGIAFSIRFPWHLQGIFIGVALVALAWAAVMAKTRWSRIAFGMILGGALANVADRLLDGVVTDFMQVGTFPIFNVADSCITVGVAILLLEALMQWKITKNQTSISR